MNKEMESAGEKIRWIGYLILINIAINGFIQYLIRESVRNFEVKNVESYLEAQIFLTLLLLLVKSILFIRTGNDLIRLNNPVVSNGVISDNSAITEELIVNKVFYPNGGLKVLESYNKDNKKHGVWEHYLENGSLDFKELYQNGNWVQNIRN